MSTPLLSLDNVTFAYPPRSILVRAAALPVVQEVSLNVRPGECVGLIGESGSGKSTVAGLAAGLLEPTTGDLRICGEEAGSPQGRPLALRRRAQIVFQDPYGSLDPTFTVERIVAEGLHIHRLGDRAERRVRVRAALDDVGLSEDFLARRPHELSGGQRQRVAIARALAVDPDLMILDEPTSALDLMVQAQILNLLLRLQADRGLAFLLITHDLDVVRHLAHRVYVMHRGRIVEAGDCAAVLSAPADPYTQRLVASAPNIGTAA